MLSKEFVLIVFLSFAASFAPMRAAEPKSATPSPAAQPSEEKATEIRKMLRLTGMEKLMNQMMGQILDTFKSQHTGVPDEVWDRLQAKMDMKELIPDDSAL